jgi:hypothetical protein
MVAFMRLIARVERDRSHSVTVLGLPPKSPMVDPLPVLLAIEKN